MSLCINPQCPNPENPDTVRFCQSCGCELLLKGRYRAIREMGKGGFAKTFEVSDGGTHKVLKVLHLNDPKPVSLFQQEARVLGQLNDPGIPKGYEYFTVSPRNNREPMHCLVMEYVEGQDLWQWFQKQGNNPIDTDLAIAWLRELASILHKVHQKNFFHRDIKPSNIMLKPDGRLSLIDFGAAREVSHTYLQKVKGGLPVTGIVSAGYTAPEQAIGKAVPQSDFFSLGRTFVFFLTGKEPTAFGEDPRTGKLQWRSSAPQVASLLADFIDELMALLPANRPQSTGDLLQRLGELDRKLSRRSGQSKQVSTTAATVPVSPHHRSGNTGIGSSAPSYTKWIVGGVILLLGWVGWSIFQSERSRDRVTERPATPPLERPKSGDTEQTPELPIEEPQTPVPPPEDTEFPPSHTPPSEQETPVPPTEDRKSPPSQTPPSGQETPAPEPGEPKSPPQPPLSTQPTPPVNPSAGNFDPTNTFQAHGEAIDAIAIAGNGDILATGSRDSRVKLWSLSTGELLRPLDRHKGWIWAIASSPDGQTIASGSADSRIELWNVRTGEHRTLYGHRDQVHAVAFSPDGQTLVSGSGGVIKENAIQVWDVNTGEGKMTIKGHTDTILAIAFSPDGQTIASGSADKTIKIWDVNTGEELKTLTSSSYVNSVAYATDGQTLVSTSGTRVSVWDVATGSQKYQLKGHRGEVKAIAVSPDGNEIASASTDKTVKLWDLRSGELKGTFEAQGGGLRSVTFSDRGQTIVAGTDSGTVNIWRVQ